MRLLLRLALGALAAVALACVATLAVCEALQARREAAGASAPVGERVEIGDGAMFVQRFGERGRSAVVIVPGTAAWSGFWAPAARAMASAGFDVIAVDLPPFGFSYRPESGDYGRAAQAERLAALIQRLGLRRPVVLAHSFGAGAAVELAMRRPEAIGGLVLVDGALGLTAEGEPAPEPPTWLRIGLGQGWVSRALVDAVLVNPLLTRRLLAGLLARPERATPEAAAILQAPYSREGTSAAYAQWLPGLLLGDPHAWSADPARYRALNLPVALIWGAEDSVTPLAQGERLQKLVPGATLDVLPAAGHIPSLEDPDAFAAAAIARLRNIYAKY